MDPQLLRKDFVTALIGVLSLAIDRERLDDAEALLAALRILRPKLNELDTFEAWLKMKRRDWHEAIRILRGVEANLPSFQTGRAFLAMCMYMVDDPGWKAAATDVVETATDADAVAIARGLLDPESALAEAVSAGGDAPAAEPALPPVDMLQYAFAMRV